MNIKIQRITSTAKIPRKAFDTDTGYDLYADSVEYAANPPRIKVHTGIAVQPETGYYVEVFPRSSVSKKYMHLANSVGIIDESYTGEIILNFDLVPSGEIVEYDGSYSIAYMPESDVAIGEKIAQLVVRKRIDADFIEVSYLDNTMRGDGGFGSTGK